MTKLIKTPVKSHSPVVIARNAFGLVSVTESKPMVYRVVVQPASAEAASAMAKVLHRNIFVDPSWKQPGDDGENFFSVNVEGAEALIDVVSEAVQALVQGGAVEEDWHQALRVVAGLDAS